MVVESSIYLMERLQTSSTMKVYNVMMLLLAVMSCNGKVESAQPAPVLTDNPELIEIYKKDQSERSTAEIDWFLLHKNDSLRRLRVQVLLDSGKVMTGKDFARAAMVFQHGKDSLDYGKAVALMETAIEKDSSINKWLYAAATDRYLLSKGEPQIYGTQYLKMGDGPWELEELDTTKITDAQRRAFGVATLEEQRLKVIEMNKEEL